MRKVFVRDIGVRDIQTSGSLMSQEKSFPETLSLSCFSVLNRGGNAHLSASSAALWSRSLHLRCQDCKGHKLSDLQLLHRFHSHKRCTLSGRAHMRSGPVGNWCRHSLPAHHCKSLADVTELSSRSFRERISFPNLVERSILKLPLCKRCAVPFALRNRALLEGEKTAKRCRENGGRGVASKGGKKE